MYFTKLKRFTVQDYVALTTSQNTSRTPKWILRALTTFQGWCSSPCFTRIRLSFVTTEYRTVCCVAHFKGTQLAIQLRTLVFLVT